MDDNVFNCIDGKRRSRRLHSRTRVIMTEVDEYDGEDEATGIIEERIDYEELEIDDSEQPKAKKHRGELTSSLAIANKDDSTPLDEKEINYRISFDDFDGLIMQVIFSLLPTKRDLYNIVQTSKRMRSLLTYEHIIRAAVLGGDRNSGIIAENIVGAVEHSYIHVPTKQRLLRLTNARYCERGNDCWAFNMKQNRSRQVADVSKFTGLAICYECDSALFSCFKGELGNWGYAASRFISNGFFAWRAPFNEVKEKVTNAPIGPYVTMKVFKQLHHTYPVRRRDTLEQQLETKQERLQHLTEIYGSMKANDINFEEGTKLPALLSAAQADLADRKARVINLQMSERRKKAAKKLARSQAVHKFLVKCIGNPQWKEAALSINWIDPQTPNFELNEIFGEYNCGFVQSLMSRFLSAPSYFTKKAVRNISIDIRTVFDNMHGSNFFEYGFLSEDNEWENALRQAAIAKVPETTFWLMSRSIFTRLSSRSLFQDFISEMNFRNGFAQVTCSNSCKRYSNDFISDVFAMVAHDGDPANHRFFDEASFRTFARRVYHLCTETQIQIRSKTLDQVKMDLHNACILYNDMKRKLIAYLDSERTEAFLNLPSEVFNEDIPNILSNSEIVRRSILRGGGRDLHMIQNVQYDSLLSSHQDYARNQTFLRFRWFLHDD